MEVYLWKTEDRLKRTNPGKSETPFCFHHSSFAVIKCYPQNIKFKKKNMRDVKICKDICIYF